MALTLLSVALASLSGLTRASVRALTVSRALDVSHAHLATWADSVAATRAHGTGERRFPSGHLSWSVPSLPGEPAWGRFTHHALDRPVELHFVTRAEW